MELPDPEISRGLTFREVEQLVLRILMERGPIYGKDLKRIAEGLGYLVGVKRIRMVLRDLMEKGLVRCKGGFHRYKVCWVEGATHKYPDRSVAHRG